MSTATDKAALAQGPIAAADATGLTGVSAFTVTAAHSYTIPVELRGKFIDLYCSAEIAYAFSVGAGATLVAGATTAGTAIAGGATIGKTLPAGVDRAVLVPNNATHLNVVGTSGRLEIVCSEGRVAL